ncbi:MAG TPA: 50S ribosomal protein L20, partial [Hyphomonadaceae bacterium]|nr:50S ribosomal protein L20 [Hyphomonadaceae bacterium]
AAVLKSGVNAYKGRKQKKRNFRSLWIQRINAAVRTVDDGFTYSRFIAGLSKAGISVDRKVMADLAVQEPAAFTALVEKARAALA